ncbi:hypothetical protein [Nocardia sp. NPDC059239]|uniref:hypothetical protein n=1 Tax=unclassified Nocardia TaxID=2637762 RepID=UPI00367F3B16
MAITALIISIIAATTAIGSLGVSIWQTRLARRAMTAADQSATAAARSAAVAEQQLTLEYQQWAAQRAPRWTARIDKAPSSDTHQLRLTLETGTIDHTEVEIRSPGIGFTASQNGVAPEATWPIKHARHNGLRAGQTATWRVQLDDTTIPPEIELHVTSAHGDDTWTTTVHATRPSTARVY